MHDHIQDKICVLGLGYVGLPLAVCFARKYKVIGFDINEDRISKLKNGFDETGEIDRKTLEKTSLKFTSNIKEIKQANIFIITVPTPVDDFNTPDLRPLKLATETVAQVLKINDIVIYESTVYPGCSEEICVPILEQKSTLQYNKDFFLGYSPERINPADKAHSVENIIKVTSGSTPAIADRIDQLYKTVITAGTFKANSIKVAEAAKAIENAQRDINIAFVNELAILFSKININTNEVLAAAATKWNFLNFKPGLVGGHCIGVDPYYLTHKAKSLGYHPELILAGRRLNDNMAYFVACEMAKLMIKKGHNSESIILILGLSFKENCPDMRNSKVFDLAAHLEDFGFKVLLHDPLIDEQQLSIQHQKQYIKTLNHDYKGIILAVNHQVFAKLDFTKLKDKQAILYDLKNALDKNLVDGSL